MLNKKGVSMIVTTLIIVALVLVAIGIVWVVLRNVIEGGIEQVDYNTKCLDVNVRATALENTGTTLYDFTLRRDAGTEEFDGVKLVFIQTGEEVSSVYTIEENIVPLSPVSFTDFNGGIVNADTIEVTPYFVDASGNEKLCSTGSFSF